MSDPVCYVRCCGESQHTTIEKKTLSPYWEQMFFFNLKLGRQQFLDAKLQFQVYNANTFRRNELIGSYEFDLVCSYTHGLNCLRIAIELCQWEPRS